MKFNQKSAIIAAILTAVFLTMAAVSYTPSLPAKIAEQKYTSEHSHFVEVDGLRMHYSDQGVGSVLVLLHGSNDSLQAWNHWSDLLSDQYRIISIDLPGHGLTGPDAMERYDWLEMAQLTSKLLSQIGITSYSVGGNSMGGAVAWNLALTDAKRVQKLVLVNSRGYPAEEPKPLIFKAFGTWGIGHILSVVTPRSVIEANLKDAVGSDQLVTEKLIIRFNDMVIREGNRNATRLRFAEESNDPLLPLLKDLSIPTLILWGDRDKWILPKYADWFARDIADSKVIIYPNVGHLPMEEVPQQSAEDVRAFLAGEI